MASRQMEVMAFFLLEEGMEYGTAWTTIANQALQLLGRPPVSDIASDKGYGTVAPILRNQIPISVRFILGMRNWRCLYKKVSLARLAERPVDYAYRYAIPSDAVRLVSVMPEDGYSYERLDGYIDTNAESVIATYIPEPSSTSALPSYLQNVVACHIAIYIAPLLNADQTLQASVASMYTASLQSAWLNDISDVNDKIFMGGFADDLARAREV